jgi:hypothetical protein
MPYPIPAMQVLGRRKQKRLNASPKSFNQISTIMVIKALAYQSRSPKAAKRRVSFTIFQYGNFAAQS